MLIVGTGAFLMFFVLILLLFPVEQIHNGRGSRLKAHRFAFVLPECRVILLHEINS